MKKAMTIADPSLRFHDADYILWVHDEFQAEVSPERADFLGDCMVRSIQEAGEYYNLRVRLDGDYKVGTNWSETH